jgi:hypothetical protein
MSDHLAQLAQRRAALQRRAEQQREDLGAQVRAFEARVGGFDRLLGAGQLLRKPVVLAAGAALLFFLGPRRVLKISGRALLLFSTARRLFGFIGKRPAA